MTPAHTRHLTLANCPDLQSHLQGRWRCCARERDADPATKFPGDATTNSATWEEFLDNGARLAAALLAYTEAAACRHRAATAVWEAAAGANLLDLRDPVPVRILARITTRAEDLISPMAR